MSLKAEAVRDLITKADAKREDELGEYLEHQRVRMELFKERYAPIIRERLTTDMPETGSKVRPVWINLYGTIIERRAGGFYRAPPARTFSVVSDEGIRDADKAQVVKALLMLGGRRFDGAMNKVALYLEMCRALLIQVRDVRGKARFDVLPPLEWYIDPSDEDPVDITLAKSISIFHGTENAQGERARVLWVPQVVENEDTALFDRYVLDAEGNILEQDNYSELPFMLTLYDIPDSSIYLSGGDTLEEFAIHYAATLSDMVWVERFQSIGVPVFEGGKAKDGGAHVLSPGEIFFTEQGQKFNFETPEDRSKLRRDGLSRDLVVFTRTMALSGTEFDEKPLPDSAVTMRVTSANLVQHRQSYARLLAEIEDDLFHIANRVLGGKVDNMLVMNVTHVDRTAPLDPIEATENDQRKIGQGVISSVDVIMKDQGVPRDAAEEMYYENIRLNRLLGAPVDAGTEDLRRAQAAAVQARSTRTGEMAGDGEAAGEGE